MKAADELLDGAQPVDELAHRRLLRSIASLAKGADGTNIKGAWEGKDKEAGTGATVSFEELLNVVGAETKIDTLKNQLAVAKNRQNILSAPIHRQQREKIARRIAYDGVKSQLKQWEPIVRKNRLAEHLEFPLNQVPLQAKTISEIAEERFQARTTLEIESARILGNSKHNLTNDAVLTEAEKELLKATSLKEARRRTSELQKIRALMSYQEAKFKRNKRIKSKRYRRLRKKEKRKEILKEFAEMQEKDPEAAQEKLELLERDRIMERATLKHRGTGQWAKDLRLHARHDPKTREALQDQLRLGRELAHKHAAHTDDAPPNTLLEELVDEVASDKGDDEKTTQFLGSDETDNPWIKSTLARLRNKSSSGTPKTVTTVQKNPESEVAKSSELLKDGDKVREDNKTKMSRTTKKRKKQSSLNELKPDNVSAVNPVNDEVSIARNTEDQLDFNTSLKSKKSRKTKRTGEKVKKQQKAAFLADKQKSEHGGKRVSDAETTGGVEMLNPEKFLQPAPRPRSEPRADLIEDDTEDGGLLAEAFADEDMVQVFQEEKDKLVEDQTPKDLDITLPGWGAWAGPSTDPGRPYTQQRSRKRFIIKAPPAPPRRDKLLHGVIINETEDPSIRKLQVSELPFPFKCVEDFEASLSHPIGKEWNTHTAHRALTQPQVTTKQGAIIAPMNKELTLRNAPANQRPQWLGDEDQEDGASS